MAVSIGPTGLTLDNFVLPNTAKGTVVQYLDTTDGTRRKYTTVVNNSWLTSYTALNTTLTPLLTDSKLVFWVEVHYGVDNPNAGSVYWQIREGTTIMGVLNGDTAQDFPSFGHSRWYNANTDHQYHTETARINGGVINNTSTSSRTFNLYFRVQGNGVDVSINRDGADSSDSNQGNHSPTLRSRMMIMEVAT
jgi:hypothetical protein